MYRTFSADFFSHGIVARHAVQERREIDHLPIDIKRFFANPGASDRLSPAQRTSADFVNTLLNDFAA